MIFQRKVKHPWHYGVKILQYVCTCCGNIHDQRPSNGKCKSCKR